MAAVYYERIDVEGHHYGPSSVQRKDALKAVDRGLSNMMELIKVSDMRKERTFWYVSFLLLLMLFYNSLPLNMHVSVQAFKGTSTFLFVKYWISAL